MKKTFKQLMKTKINREKLPYVCAGLFVGALILSMVLTKIIHLLLA